MHQRKYVDRNHCKQPIHCTLHIVHCALAGVCISTVVQSAAERTIHTGITRHHLIELIIRSTQNVEMGKEKTVAVPQSWNIVHMLICVIRSQ